MSSSQASDYSWDSAFVKIKELGGITTAQSTVYFVTNRNKTGDDDPEDYFGDDRGQLYFGQCSLEILFSEKVQKISKLIPFQFTTKKVTLKALKLQSKRDFIKNIRNQTEPEILILIHGYNYSFEKSCKSAAQVQSALKYKGPVIIFSWPSDSNLLNYTRDEADAVWSSYHLKQVLSQLTGNGNTLKVNIVAHSLGGRLLFSALNQMTDKKIALQHVVFTAPDVDSAIFKQNASQFLKLAKQVTL